MSTPLVWILFPGGLAFVLYVVRNRQRGVLLTGILVAALLAFLAWKLPIGQPISLGPLQVTLAQDLSILGRRFTIDDSSRPVLILVYLAMAFWFGGAWLARTDRLFVPLGLGITSLFIAALSVEPFLYAALLIEIAAIVSVPILSPPGRPVGRGVIRFLTFQTLGMPFVLFAGYLLPQVQLNPADSTMVLRATVLLALGFAFFMSIFPFHTWIPMVTEEAHPYAAAFVFFMLPGVIALFGLGLLERYSWMRSEPAVFQGLRYMGSAMVVIGGIWAAFQRHLGRMMGYAVVVEIGLSLLAISLGFGPAVAAGAESPLRGIFFTLVLPRGLSLAIWGLALTAIQRQSGDLSFRAVHGVARRIPAVTTALLMAHFSLAGLPLLAGFPTHLALWSALAAQSLPAAGAAVLGNAGLLAGGIRSLVVLTMGKEETGWRVDESWATIGLLALGCLALLLIGVFPEWFLPFLANLAQVFGPKP